MNVESAPDPTSIAHRRASQPMQPHVALLVASVQQAFDDARCIAHGKRMAGQATGLRAKWREELKREAVDLRAWAADDGPMSLAWHLDCIHAATGMAWSLPDVRARLLAILDGTAVAGGKIRARAFGSNHRQMADNDAKRRAERRRARERRAA